MGFAQLYRLPFMVGKQLTHPGFIGKDYFDGTLSAKDKVLDGLVKVNVPSQYGLLFWLLKSIL